MAAEPGTCLLVQFAREPVAGAVKTRMIPHLSPAEACALHTELVLWTASTLVGSQLGPVELAVAGDTGHPLFECCRDLGVGTVTAQAGADLGARMHYSLQDGLTRFERVILVGSDCPGIDREYLLQAVAALDKADVVLGPATDGGYVLIGVRRVWREMFDGIAWGGAAVFARTSDILDQLDIGWSALPPLADIDRPEDLPDWAALRDAAGKVRPGSGRGQLLC